MLVDVAGWSHLVILAVVLAVIVASLIMLWRSNRHIVEKLVWTALILFITPVGVIGWQGNYWIGRLADRLNRPRGSAS